MADNINELKVKQVHDDGTATARTILSDPNLDMASLGMAVRRNAQSELMLKEKFGQLILEEGPKTAIAKIDVLPQLPPYKARDFHSPEEDHRRAGATKVTHWKNGGELVEYADHAGYVKVPVGDGMFVSHGWGRGSGDRFNRIEGKSPYGDSRSAEPYGDILTRNGQEYELCRDGEKKYWQNIGRAF